jgi:uncharacterized protein (TIGR03083 family)
VVGGARTPPTLGPVAPVLAVWLDALAGSHDHLCDLVGELEEATLLGPSYDDEWTVAGVLSHLGSGAEIIGGTVDAVVAGEAPPSPESFPGIWARWGAMGPREVRDAALSADGGLIEKLEHLGDALDEFEYTLFGRLRVDAVGLLRVRLSEHALHTWDIAVALDPDARVDPDAVALLVDWLASLAPRLGKAERADLPRPFSVRVSVTEPDRELRLDVADDVTLADARDARPVPPTLHVPAEALLRLVYGRLDPAHAPTVAREERPTLDTLRQVFPGF